MKLQRMPNVVAKEVLGHKTHNYANGYTLAFTINMIYLCWYMILKKINIIFLDTTNR